MQNQKAPRPSAAGLFGYESSNFGLVGEGRVELPRISPPAPKAGASANFATRPHTCFSIYVADEIDNPLIKCPPSRNRTYNLRIKSPLLYQLSYRGMSIQNNTRIIVSQTFIASEVFRKRLLLFISKLQVLDKCPDYFIYSNRDRQTK